MTNYDKIVLYHTKLNPTFTLQKNRFCYNDLYIDKNINLNYLDKDWKYIEAKYLCNLLDCIILDSYFINDIPYIYFNISNIPNILEFKIADNPNINLILEELSENYDERGFYNVISFNNEYNYLSHNKCNNIIFKILFFKNLKNNLKTKENKLINNEIFTYKTKLIYMKIECEEYIKVEIKNNYINEKNNNLIEKEYNYFLNNENILNDKSYKFIGKDFNDLLFYYIYIKGNYNNNIKFNFYCYDTLIFTLL